VVLFRCLALGFGLSAFGSPLRHASGLTGLSLVFWPVISKLEILGPVFFGSRLGAFDLL
jgi:hypothetical protein